MEYTNKSVTNTEVLNNVWKTQILVKIQARGMGKSLKLFFERHIKEVWKIINRFKNTYKNYLDRQPSKQDGGLWRRILGLGK